jgi:TrmH family RNA methyltransferase
VLRVSSRNARFQQWESLLGNRGKRQRNREFLVQGVRPISLAAEFGWPFRALLYDAERQLSAWARAMLRDVPALQVAMSPGLLADLGEKEAGPPELVAVVEMPADDLDRITAGPGFLGVLLDRPASPGNIGSIIRSGPATRPTSTTPGRSGPAPARCSPGRWSAPPRTARWPPG